MSPWPVVLPGAWVLVGLALVAVARPPRRIPLAAARPTARGPLARLGAVVRTALPGRSDAAVPPTGPDRAVAGPGDLGRTATGRAGSGSGDVGRVDLRWAGSERGDDPGDEAMVEVDQVVGGALVAAAVLVVVAPTLAPLPVVGALAAPRLVRRRRERRERERWAEALPDAVDLLALGLGSGVAVGSALALVAPHTPAPVGPALARADERVRHGAPVALALEPLAAASADGRSLVALLVAAHHDGAPVVDALSRLAADLRADRRRAVEARARQVPVRMLFPLVACTLPAFVLLTIVPPVVAALSDLQR